MLLQFSVPRLLSFLRRKEWMAAVKRTQEQHFAVVRNHQSAKGLLARLNLFVLGGFQCKVCCTKAPGSKQSQ